MSDIDRILKNDLELALNLIVGYQRELYTLNAPDSYRAPANELLRKYKITPYKAADGYRVVVQDKSGKSVDISDNPEGEPLAGRIATNFTTGESRLVDDDEVPDTIDRTKCPEHGVPLRNGICHRCKYGKSFYGINGLPELGME